MALKGKELRDDSQIDICIQMLLFSE
jgi:hypothetical protein